jgi:hypothetical protein
MVMTIERVYFREHNFVLTIIFDKLTGRELAEHVLAMNRDYASIKGIRELADCRFLTDVSELDEGEVVFSASKEQGSLRVVGGRGAVVATSDEVYKLAKMYCDIAAQIREDAKVFRSMDDAIRWLELEDFKKDFLPLISEAFCDDRTRELVCAPIGS